MGRGGGRGGIGRPKDKDSRDEYDPAVLVHPRTTIPRTTDPKTTRLRMDTT